MNFSIMKSGRYEQERTNEQKVFRIEKMFSPIQYLVSE